MSHAARIRQAYRVSRNVSHTLIAALIMTPRCECVDSNSLTRVLSSLASSLHRLFLHRCFCNNGRPSNGPTHSSTRVTEAFLVVEGNPLGLASQD